MSATSALEALARDADRFADEWPRDAARLVEDEARRQLLRDTGDGRFSRSHDGRRTSRHVSAGAGRADVTARGGVWTWLEEGTRPTTTTGQAGQGVADPVRAAAGGAGPWCAARAHLDPRRRRRPCPKWNGTPNRVEQAGALMADKDLTVQLKADDKITAGGEESGG